MLSQFQVVIRISSLFEFAAELSSCNLNFLVEHSARDYLRAQANNK